MEFAKAFETNKQLIGLRGFRDLHIERCRIRRVRRCICLPPTCTFDQWCARRNDRN